MTLVVRGAEPAALIAARSKHLAHAVDLYNLHGAPSTQLSSALVGYDAKGVKQALFEAQHKKCAWCDRRRDFSSSPIEHYRPKDGAWRSSRGEVRRSSQGHYWWLTWTWENLLFACPRCNDPGHKGSYFPLAAGSTEMREPARPSPTTLSPRDFDISGECPLLLDPAADVFLDHVRWIPSNTRMARKLWTWSPSALSDRGRATIEVLRLAELADEVQSHLVDHVLPRVEEVERHLHGRRSQQAATSWDALLELLQPDRNFTAATWCALVLWTEEWLGAASMLTPIPRPV